MSAIYNGPFGGANACSTSIFRIRRVNALQPQWFWTACVQALHWFPPRQPQAPLALMDGAGHPLRSDEYY